MDNILKLFPQDKLQLLSKEEEEKIFENPTCEDRERIFLAHARLIVKFAKKYEGYGLDLEDLVSEGNIGLFKAIDHFDRKRGIKFSYYCSFWIKQRIIKALAKRGRLIRLPAGITSDFLNILKLYETYEMRGKENPSDEKVAAKLKIPLRRVKNILSATKNLVYIDSPVTGSTDGQRLTGESIEDGECVLPFETIDKKEKLRSLEKYVRKLNIREQLIIKGRFGLADEGRQTLNQIAGGLKLSKERVRQIEAEIILKLKEMFHKESSF
jgi:RNA polymerase primary sigma factor